MSRKNKKLKSIEKEVIFEANKNYIPTILVLDELIESVITELKNFVPSVGNKTLSDIDNNAKEIIKSVQNSREFANLMKDKERKIELKEAVLQLSKVRATKWESQAFFGLQMIRSKAAFLKSDFKNYTTVKKIKQARIWK